MSPGRLETLFVVDELDPLAVRARQAGVEVQLVNDDVMAQAHLHRHPPGPGRAWPRSSTSALEAPPDRAAAWRSCTRCATPGTPGPCCARPTPPAPPASCSPPPRSTSTTRRPCAPRPARSSICPWCARSTTAEAVDALRARVPRPGDGGRRRARPLPHRPVGARRVPVRQRGPRAAPRGRGRWPTIPVRVPHAGRAESLNLAAAATVCLFERARRVARGRARRSSRSSPRPPTTSGRR